MKASAADKPHCGVTFHRDLDSVSKLEVLIDWCSARGLAVNFSRKYGGVYYGDKKLITVNGRLAPEIQLFVLMHECGHHLIGKRSPKERYGLGHQADDPDIKRTTLHRVDVLDEELEAWARGLKLAKRQGIKVDLDRYNKTRSEYIKTYLKWAVHVGGYGKEEDDDEKT